MSHSCFLCSSTDGHLSCFQILATVNNAGMHMGVLILFRISVFVSSDKLPEVESLGHKAVPFLIKLNTKKTPNNPIKK